MYLIDRLGLTFDFSATQKITYATTVANIEGRIDADYYSPKFSHFRSQIEALPYRTVSVDDISEKIVSGFAAGKQDQADNLPEDQRVPHLRPFSITPEGELSFETKKYVPKSRLKSEDYCKKNEVIFNNTNSPDLVGKTTVFDSDVLCAASNHMTRITVKEGVNPYYVAAFFMKKELCIDTVRQLERLYPSLSGAVFHSDRGSQYTSLAFRSELSRCGMIQSLSGTGHCFDNARMESFFATLKKEKIYQIAAYKLPREQVKTIIFRYVFTYYNRVRIYTRNPLGLPPAKYREWAQAQTAA